MQWRIIPGFPNYRVSNTGLVKSMARYGGTTSRIRKLSVNKDGYLTVSLPKGDGKTKLASVHRLVLSAFRPRPDESSMVVNHKNGIKVDNRLANLEWCSISHNTKHAYRTLGVQPANKVISDAQAIEIVREYDKGGITRRELALKYGVVKATIDRRIRKARS